MRRLGLVALFAATAAAQWAVPGSLIWKSEKILTEGKPYRFRIRPVDPADLFRGRFVAIGVERSTVDLDRLPAGEEFLHGARMHASLAVDASGFAHPVALSRGPAPGADSIRVRVGWVNRQPGIEADDILDAQALLARVRAEEDPICADLRAGRQGFRDGPGLTEARVRLTLAAALTNAVRRGLEEPASSPPGEPYEERWRRGLEAVTGHFQGLIRPIPKARVAVEYPFSRYYAGEKTAPRIERAIWSPESRREGEAWVAVRVLGGDALIEELFIAGKPAREYLAGVR